MIVEERSVPWILPVNIYAIGSCDINHVLDLPNPLLPRRSIFRRGLKPFRVSPAADGYHDVCVRFEVGSYGVDGHEERVAIWVGGQGRVGVEDVGAEEGENDVGDGRGDFSGGDHDVLAWGRAEVSQLMSWSWRVRFDCRAPAHPVRYMTMLRLPASMSWKEDAMAMEVAAMMPATMRKGVMMAELVGVVVVDDG